MPKRHATLYAEQVYLLAVSEQWGTFQESELLGSAKEIPPPVK